MDVAGHDQPASISTDWRVHAKAHPYSALGLRVAIGVLLLLLLTSGWHLLSGDAGDPLRWGFFGGLTAFAATAIGALPALVIRNLSARIEDTFLGLAAGMMLAASSFSLLLPGLASGAEITGSPLLGGLTVVLGLGLGVMLMIGLDQFTPHEHPQTGAFGPGRDRISRVWLFVLAIALHNFPEGMAIGVGFSRGDMGVGLPLTTAIALQDLPEGLAVAISLRSVGLSALRATVIGAATGAIEPIGALLGVGLTSGLAISYPIGLGLAAGCMIFVVSHEVIPETHRNGHQTPATLGLMAGFAIMMLLDTTLG